MQRLGWSTLLLVLFSPRESTASRSPMSTSVAFKVTATHSGTRLAMFDEFTYQFALI